MRFILNRPLIMLLLALLLAGRSPVSAVCDPSPCQEDDNQVSVVNQQDLAGSPTNDTLSVFQSNYRSSDAEEPTNTDINQSNVIEVEAVLGAGSDSIEQTQQNYNEVNKEDAAGDDTIEQVNVSIIDADEGDDDDTVVVSQTNTQVHNAPDETSGNDSFISANVIIIDAELGAGNDLLILAQSTSINDNSPGNDTIVAVHSIEAKIDAGSGNDTLVFDSHIDVQQQGQPAGQVINLLTGSIDGGDDDDSVLLRSNQANITFGTSGDDTLFIDGGAGNDTLVLDYDGGTVSQERADAIARYLANNSSSGTLKVNGVVYTWVNFEQLVNLIRFVIEEASDSSSEISISITFTDGRLNQIDVAAPVAVYCADGGFGVWEIDPNTGSGTQVIFATLAELAVAPVSGGGATMSLTDNGLVLVTAGSYSFSFDPVACRL